MRSPMRDGRLLAHHNVSDPQTLHLRLHANIVDCFDGLAWVCVLMMILVLGYVAFQVRYRKCWRALNLRQVKAGEALRGTDGCADGLSPISSPSFRR